MRLLIVEDEEQLAEIIGRVLERERYDVDIALDGEAGLDLALTGNYDAIILDRMLPKMDGLEVLREMRNENVTTPVLILSARRELPERVEGLDVGADDYLGKPFAFDELLARVRALARRRGHEMIPSVLVAGNVRLDETARRVTVNDTEVQLSPREFSLLEYLMRNAGHALSRDQIVEHVWGYDAEPGDKAVDLYIHYLRRKLTLAGAPSPIRTVRGQGYMVLR